MEDKYVKAIKDELKGLITHCSNYASANLRDKAQAYQYALDIIEKYERKEAKDNRPPIEKTPHTVFYPRMWVHNGVFAELNWFCASCNNIVNFNDSICPCCGKNRVGWKIDKKVFKVEDEVHQYLLNKLHEQNGGT